MTFDEDSHQVVIRLQTPYVNEYLKVDNQLFQLHIWSAGSSTVTSSPSPRSSSPPADALQQLTRVSRFTADSERLVGLSEDGRPEPAAARQVPREGEGRPDQRAAGLLEQVEWNLQLLQSSW